VAGGGAMCWLKGAFLAVLSAVHLCHVAAAATEPQLLTTAAAEHQLITAATVSEHQLLSSAAAAGLLHVARNVTLPVSLSSHVLTNIFTQEER
jgi:hypothetical protein